jgi:hypothetical protein
MQRAEARRADENVRREGMSGPESSRHPFFASPSTSLADSR